MTKHVKVSNFKIIFSPLWEWTSPPALGGKQFLAKPGCSYFSDINMRKDRQGELQAETLGQVSAGATAWNQLAWM